MHHRLLIRLLPAAVLSAGLTACAGTSGQATDARAQVWAAEQAFARTMAERDAAAFAEHIADEAIFFAGTTPLRGKAAVLAAWAGYFSGPEAPFSWAPDQVEVLASGDLALSTGPVRNPAGQVFARFTSVWRLGADGRWRVVLDKGGPPSPGPAPA
jgi:ketosteroid isomerase-like protein